MNLHYSNFDIADNISINYYILFLSIFPKVRTIGYLIIINHALILHHLYLFVNTKMKCIE